MPTRSVDSIRASLEKVLDDEELRRDMGRIGMRIAQNYHWEVSARKTWAFWTSIS